ncbi:organomercurial lyase [Streptomyces sp. NPDC056773]|uniref:organomercurial lyase n=1 Tax=Streptomyces sp. NPDC056773 TaxID=3345941 RepID=UPI0036C86F01
MHQKVSHSHVSRRHPAGTSRSGPAAAVCCDALNFFGDAAGARSWAALHPEVTGEGVDQERAREIGRQTFGPLLTGD